MNRKQLAKRLREHAELHEELSEHRDEEQLQWEHDIRAAADIVEAEDGGREMKCDETPKLSEREAELINGMIEHQIEHARRCDNIANRAMAEKQKAKDMERAEVLRKVLWLLGSGK